MVTRTGSNARGSAKAAPWSLKATFWLDVVLLAAVCLLEAVSFTGLVLHEWLGLAIAFLILVHLLSAWTWIASQSRRVFSTPSIRAWVNYLLNLSLFACVTAVLFSGLLISQHALPALTGASAVPEIDRRWDTLHNQLSGYLMLLAGFHLALNWDWVLGAAEKIFSGMGDDAL